MRPVSAAARLALRSNGSMPTWRMEIWDEIGQVASTEWSPYRLPLLPGGVVQVERRAAHRRNFSATLADVYGSIVPGTGGTFLDPVSCPIVKCFRGVQWYQGNSLMHEEWPLGEFVLEDATPVEERDGIVIMDIGGLETSSRIASNPWKSPFRIAASTLYSEAIKQIIVDRTAGLFTPRFNFATSTDTLGRSLTLGTNSGNNPWYEAQKLAQDDGKELFQDATGTFVLQPIPNLETEPTVWDYTETGETTGLLTDPMQRGIFAREIKNGVVVRVNAPWLLTPIRGEVWDDNPGSPTYRFGPLGERPLEIDDSTVQSKVKAQEMAAAKYPDVIGIVEDVQFTGLTNPAHEAGDVIQVSNSSLGLDDKVMLEAFQITMGNQPKMPVTIRRRRKP